MYWVVLAAGHLSHGHLVTVWVCVDVMETRDNFNNRAQCFLCILQDVTKQTNWFFSYYPRFKAITRDTEPREQLVKVQNLLTF